MKEISFRAEYSEEPGHCGAPVYLEDEQSLNYEPFDKRVDFSILLGELYVGLDMSGSTGLVSQLSGFLPKRIWQERDLTPPDAPNGRLYAHLDLPMVRGGGTQYQEERDWPVYFCAARKCLCIGDPAKRPRSQYVQFCEGITAQLDGPRLVSLWVLLGKQGQLKGGEVTEGLSRPKDHFFTKREWVFWLSLTLAVLLIIGTIFLVSYESCVLRLKEAETPLEFTQERWAQAPDDRYRMLESLWHQYHGFEKMTREEVRSLLGEPDSVFSEFRDLYFVQEGKGLGPATFLSISYDEAGISLGFSLEEID